MQIIPEKESGIEATWKRELELHPLDKAGKPFPWWKRRAEILHLLVGNSNALVQEATATRNDLNSVNNALTSLAARITKLENEPPPFP